MLSFFCLFHVPRDDISKMSNPRLFYEDLENRRQPSLYYLSSEDVHEGGPHLILDWNGPPTNYDEFDIDIMSKFITDKTTTTAYQSTSVQSDYHSIDADDRMTETIFHIQSNLSHTVPTQNNDVRCNLLTVPTIASTLLERLMNREALDQSTVYDSEEGVIKEDRPNSPEPVRKLGRPKKCRSPSVDGAKTSYSQKKHDKSSSGSN